MSRKVHECELEGAPISRDCFSEMRTFLETWQLTACEAQIIWEVVYSRQHHIGLSDLSRRIPKEFRQVHLDSQVKGLIQGGKLQPYPSKKDEMCFRSTSLGRDIAYLINEHCYSGKLRCVPELHQEFSEQNYLLCFDPQGFKVGQKRYATGLKGEKLAVVVRSKSKSKHIFRKTKDGKPVFEIKIEAEISICPGCGTEISIDFCLSPSSCYREFITVTCQSCKTTFKLRHALDKFFYPSPQDT